VRFRVDARFHLVVQMRVKIGLGLSGLLFVLRRVSVLSHRHRHLSRRRHRIGKWNRSRRRVRHHNCDAPSGSDIRPLALHTGRREISDHAEEGDQRVRDGG